MITLVVELAMLVALCTIMWRAAEMEDMSPMLWGMLTLVLCIGVRYVVPLPMIRMVLAGLIAFGAMTVYKAVGNR